ncbi:MAG: SIMPL domain-containing protein [Acidocella sp.]|uniref:SIMPL domain-containing protein n=1 Tax=Acidocella sp. TaxID=50710 RepID=UPI003FC22210
MRRTALTAMLFALSAMPAGAQTMLTIGATGETEAVPDEAVASLTVHAELPTASAAQASVNKQMSKVLPQARAVPGVVVTTGAYTAFQQFQPPGQSSPPTYQANQTLQLTMKAAGGVPSAAFADLLGNLQQQGVLMNNLGGDLSATARTAAQQQAIVAALDQIEAQAEAVAAQLHERVGPVKTLTVNAAPPPRPVPMMAMAVGGAAPPVSAPGNIQVSADVTATIELDAAQN